MTPLLAELPDPSYLVAGCVILGIIALIGIAAVLRFFQQLRTSLAEELKRELSAAREPSAVAVQQPLEVKEHTSYASMYELKTVEKEVHGRIKRERDEINAALQELREEDRRLRAKLEQEIKDLNQTVDEIPVKTIELLQKTKGLIA